MAGSIINVTTKDISDLATVLTKVLKSILQICNTTVLSNMAVTIVLAADLVANTNFAIPLTRVVGVQVENDGTGQPNHIVTQRASVNPSSESTLSGSLLTLRVEEAKPLLGLYFDPFLFDTSTEFYKVQGSSVVYPKNEFGISDRANDGPTISRLLRHLDSDDFQKKRQFHFTYSARAVSDHSPAKSLDADWVAAGYVREWGDTPAAFDIGTPVENYFLSDHWKNNAQNHTFYYDNGNVAIATAPDGTPAIKSTIDPSINLRSFAVHGRQFGDSGLQKKNVVIYFEFYTDLQVNGGIEHPQGRSGGLYTGFGHHIISRVGDNSAGISGAGNYVDGNATFRIGLSNSGYYYSWTYLFQNEHSRNGVSYLADAKFDGVNNSSARNRWIPVAIEINLNDVGVANGGFTMWVDGRSAFTKNSLEIREYSDQWLKGFGMFHATNGAETVDHPETLYYRNMIIYGKD